MSRKVAAFASVITTPLNTHNFEVVIPNTKGAEFSMIVESTSFPSYKFRDITLWTHGEKVVYPGLPEGSTDWQVTVPEADSAYAYNTIRALYKEIYDEKSGTMVIPKFRDIQVFSRTLVDDLVFGCILHGAWFKGVDPVQLNAASPDTPWKWPLTFTFSWIETLDSQAKETPNPFRN